MHLFKGLINNFYYPWIKSKNITLPIAGRAHAFYAAFAYIFILLYEIPNFFVEFFALHFKTASSFFFKFLFKDHLCFKTGMVCARKPQSFFTLHARVSY